MIYLIEYELLNLIKSGIKTLRDNPQMLHKIFSRDADKLDRLSSFISEVKVPVILGFPRVPAEVPCYCILLSSESGEQDGLGDYDDDLDTISSFTESLDVKVDTEVSPYPFIQVSNLPLRGITEISNPESGSLEPEFDYDVYNHELGIIAITSGFRGSLSVSYEYAELSNRYSSLMFDSTYNIEVWSSNAELTSELYGLLKWMILSGKKFLINRGVLKISLSGADLAPAPQFLPDFVYRRVLKFTCDTIQSASEDVIDYIQSVEVNMNILEGEEQAND